MERKSNVDLVTIVKVIKVESIFGKGVEGDPVHKVIEYYTLEGQLIVRVNDLTGERETVDEITYLKVASLPNKKLIDAAAPLVDAVSTHPAPTGLE